jgi:dienelactone hydrolase
MKRVLLLACFICSSTLFAQPGINSGLNNYLSPEKVASDFKKLLERPAVEFKPSFETIRTDSVRVEKGFIYTEQNQKVPVLIYKPNTQITSFPVVICLHGTGGRKDEDNITNLLTRLTRAGFMGVAIDARYHGERVPGGANKSVQYVDAITKAWQSPKDTTASHPFYYDTVYDLWRLVDYLLTRNDVSPKRIGMMGISMGGIETWMAASVDSRIKVAVPVIAVQSFNWSLENNKWQGRAGTIWKAHQQAATDLGDTAVTKESVKALWNKVVTGITGEFDCPSMIRLFAPRPLLLLSNEKDQNCPLEGAKIAFASARKAYQAKKAVDKLKIHITSNEPHRFLEEHAELTIDWFRKWL